MDPSTVDQRRSSTVRVITNVRPVGLPEKIQRENRPRTTTDALARVPIPSTTVASPLLAGYLCVQFRDLLASATITGRGEAMPGWWAEEWSFGHGRTRTYCGITHTEEGYAVDVFRGDTCVDSFMYGSLTEARRVAQALRLQYRNQLVSSGQNAPGRTSA